MTLTLILAFQERWTGGVSIVIPQANDMELKGESVISRGP